VSDFIGHPLMFIYSKSSQGTSDPHEIYLTSLTLNQPQLFYLKLGAVAEWLEHSPLVLKVPGSKHSLYTGMF